MADPPAPDTQLEQASPAAAPADPAEDAPVEKSPAAPLTLEPDAAAVSDGAAGEVEDEEYVSDPDDEALPTMRRREASDDEGSEDGRPRARIGPDQDDDGQGGPEAYDDEVDEEDEEYYDEEEEDLGEGFEEYEGRAAPPMEDGGGGGGGQVSRGEDGVAGEEGLPEGEAKGEGEEKEQEPFAVPTSGAFYMHDDRFQEENRGRRRCVWIALNCTFGSSSYFLNNHTYCHLILTGTTSGLFALSPALSKQAQPNCLLST